MTSLDSVLGAPQALFDSAVAGIVERFGATYVRMWLVAPNEPSGVVLAAEGNGALGSARGGLTISAVNQAMHVPKPTPEMIPSVSERDVRFVGHMAGYAFLGLPLYSDGSTLGYIEAYTASPVSFSLAAEIERYAAQIAEALVSAQSTTEMECPSRGMILIADDDAATRLLLRKVLESARFTVIDVADGALACEAAAERHPDLVLIDWMMPVMDGRAATERMKADPATRQIPVVMLTSQSHIDEKIDALQAGVQDFITKPFNERELVARIEQQLRWRRLLSPEESDPPPAPAALKGSAVFGLVPRVGVVRDTSVRNIIPGGVGRVEGDVWSHAVEAQQTGRPREALALFLTEAERCDDAKRYSRAAIAYRSASMAASQLQDRELSHKLLRLAGKMYLCWAETAPDAKSMQEGYLCAARCFLATGNLQMAKKSVDLASSFDSVMSDERPAALDEMPS